jgi:ABC-type phosphate transport system substrate-binding protein
MKKTFFLLVGLVFLVVQSVMLAQDTSFKIVVNTANPIASISKDDLSKLFLKKSTTWKNGREVIPVDQSERSPVRENFSKNIHDRPVAAIKSYWQQQMFSGRSTPPTTKSSDGELLSFVQQNPDAIGYVSSSVAISGVKVVDIIR